MMRRCLLALIAASSLMIAAALIANTMSSKAARSALRAETSHSDIRDNTFNRQDWPSYQMKACREGPIECGLLVW